ncbi:MAG: hypothetical protein IT371_02925 [Deltaproteobacteria bacterium]|nr:hypothetical protein [Deltaproteobacteria bacterium]
MDRTPFSAVLEEMVAALPGTRGAAFIDWEGEAVDVSAEARATQARIVGAHWGIIYQQLRAACERLDLGQVLELHLRCQQEQVFLRRISSDYYLVLWGTPALVPARVRQLLHAAEGRLREEM